MLHCLRSIADTCFVDPCELQSSFLAFRVSGGPGSHAILAALSGRVLVPCRQRNSKSWASLWMPAPRLLALAQFQEQILKYFLDRRLNFVMLRLRPQLEITTTEDSAPRVCFTLVLLN